MGRFFGRQARWCVSFKSDISVSKSNVVTVHETIVYDPEDNTHHGIYRWVPAQFSGPEGRYYTTINNGVAIDENGNPVPDIKVHKDKGHFTLNDLKTVEFPELLQECLK